MVASWSGGANSFRRLHDPILPALLPGGVSVFPTLFAPFLVALWLVALFDCHPCARLEMNRSEASRRQYCHLGSSLALAEGTCLRT